MTSGLPICTCCPTKGQMMLITVAEQSKVRVCGRLLAGIAGSNPAGGLDVCLLWVLCVAMYRSLRQGDQRNVVCLSVISKLQQWGGLCPLGMSCHEKIKGQLRNKLWNKWHTNFQNQVKKSDGIGVVMGSQQEERAKVKVHTCEPSGLT